MSLTFRDPQAVGTSIQTGVSIDTPWGPVLLDVTIPSAAIAAGAGSSLTRGLNYGAEALMDAVTKIRPRAMTTGFVGPSTPGAAQLANSVAGSVGALAVPGSIAEQNHAAIASVLQNPHAPASATVLVRAIPTTITEEAMLVARDPSSPEAAAVLTKLEAAKTSLDPSTLKARAECLDAIEAARAVRAIQSDPASFQHVVAQSQNDESALAVRQACAASSLADAKAQGRALGQGVARGDRQALATCRTLGARAQQGDTCAAVAVAVAASVAPSVRRSPVNLPANIPPLRAPGNTSPAEQVPGIPDLVPRGPTLNLDNAGSGNGASAEEILRYGGSPPTQAIDPLAGTAPPMNPPRPMSPVGIENAWDKVHATPTMFGEN